MRASSENRRWWDGANETPPDALCTHSAESASPEREGSECSPASCQTARERPADIDAVPMGMGSRPEKTAEALRYASDVVDAGQLVMAETARPMLWPSHFFFIMCDLVLVHVIRSWDN